MIIYIGVYCIPPFKLLLLCLYLLCIFRYKFALITIALKQNRNTFSCRFLEQQKDVSFLFQSATCRPQQINVDGGRWTNELHVPE